MKRILISDDDAVMRMMLKMVLKKKPDWEVLETTDGNEAWQRLLTETTLPDLCILDSQMPGMDGITLLRQIRGHEKFKDLPVIFVTLDSAKTTVRQACELGVKAFIVKPYTSTRVFDAVKKALAAATPHIVEIVILANPAETMMRMGIDTKDYEQLMLTFLEHFKENIEKIQNHVQAANLVDAEMVLKGLQGSCLEMGALQIADMLKYISADFSRFYSYNLSVIFREPLEDLRKAFENFRKPNKEMVTMCAWTKKIHYQGQWVSLEHYFAEHMNVLVTHGISEEAHNQLLKSEAPRPREKGLLHIRAD